MNTFTYSYSNGISEMATGIAWEARFCLTELSGCPSIVISHGAEVREDLRGQGLGDKVHKSRLNIAQNELQKDYIICTVNADNVAQLRILKKNKWKLLDSFIDACSHHKVCIYGKKLTPTGCG